MPRLSWSPLLLGATVLVLAAACGGASVATPPSPTAAAPTATTAPVASATETPPTEAPVASGPEFPEHRPE